MKITKRSILSVVLVIAMIFSVAAFMSCNKAEEEETIKVHVKITSSGGDILCDDETEITAVSSELTVLTATRQICDKLGIVFNYNDETKIVMIGDDVFGGYIEHDEEEAAEEGEDEAPAETEAETYFDWQSYLNGDEVETFVKIKAGDNIEWKWQLFVLDEQ